MKYWSAYCAVTQKLVKLGLILAGICIIILSALIGTEVFLRNFFDSSTLIADEYAGYLCAAMTFFGGAYALESGSFIRVDLLYMHFKGKVKFVADIFCIITAMAFLLCLLYYCSALVMQSYHGHVASIYISRTPLAIPQASLILGTFVMILAVIKEAGTLLIESFRRK